MNHPYEQLADLVDGTLDADDLAGVHAHLETCASCRADLAHATAGREAARSLPQVGPPADLHGNVVVAAGGLGHVAPAWYRWAGVAAAAAVVVAIAIALPNVGDNNKRAADSAGGMEAVSAPATDAGTQGQPEIVDKDYDASELKRLALDTRSETRAQGPEPQATALDTGNAARCVRRAFDEQPAGLLARLIQARFEGRPAYIAVYLEGPGAGEPPDTVVVWAATKDGCTLLSFASARI